MSLGVVVTWPSCLALHWLAARAKGEDIFRKLVLVFQVMAASTAAVNAAEIAECAAAGAAGDGSLPADPACTLTERFQSLVAQTLKVSEPATMF